MRPPLFKVNFVDANNLDWRFPNLQLYQIQLSEFENQITELAALLTSEESMRANRYRFKKDKNRFIVCRGLLKKILARISHHVVSEIIITTDKNKKPYLVNRPDIFFNVSHANNLAFIAIGATPIGIDVEFIDPNFDYNTILANTLNNQELEVLVNDENPRATFFIYWTRKEAFVKATGQGIGDNLKGLKISESSVEFIDPIQINRAYYRILSFIPKTGYVASLALREGQNVNVPLEICKLGPNT